MTESPKGLEEPNSHPPTSGRSRGHARLVYRAVPGFPDRRVLQHRAEANRTAAFSPQQTERLACPTLP